MSDTPRTDAYEQWCDANNHMESEVFDFSRNLERENGLLAKSLRRGTSGCCCVVDDSGSEVLRVCDAHAGWKEDALAALRTPAAELLYLYDWRPALAAMEKDPAADPKEVKRLLREYGERKKAGWIALRAALAANPPPEIVHSIRKR